MRKQQGDGVANGVIATLDDPRLGAVSAALSRLRAPIVPDGEPYDAPLVADVDVPIDAIPVQAVPVDEAPIEPTPVEPRRAKWAPVDPVPLEAIPLEEVEAAIEGIPAEPEPEVALEPEPEPEPPTPEWMHAIDGTILPRAPLFRPGLRTRVSDLRRPKRRRTKKSAKTSAKKSVAKSVAQSVIKRRHKQAA